MLLTERCERNPARTRLGIQAPNALGPAARIDVFVESISGGPRIGTTPHFGIAFTLGL
jgi:hypothetical protein